MLPRSRFSIRNRIISIRQCSTHIHFYPIRNFPNDKHHFSGAIQKSKFAFGTLLNVRHKPGNHDRMSYKFIIIFIFVYVLQLGILKKIYLFDKDDFRIAKAVNLLISVFIFWIITSDDNGFFTMLTNYKYFKDSIYIRTGIVSPIVNFVAKIAGNLLGIVLFVTAFNLSRRSKKYRKVLLIIVPVWAVLWLTDINRFFFVTYSSEYDEKSEYVFLIGILIEFIHFAPIFLIYNSKVFKKMMCFDNEKIREIVKDNV